MGLHVSWAGATWPLTPPCAAAFLLCPLMCRCCGFAAHHTLCHAAPWFCSSCVPVILPAVPPAASRFLLCPCRRPSKGKLPRQLAVATEAAAARQQERLEQERLEQEQQRQYEQRQRQRQMPAAGDAAAAAAAAGDELDLEELFPGEPEKAVRELIDRGDRRNTGKQRGGGCGVGRELGGGSWGCMCGVGATPMWHVKS